MNNKLHISLYWKCQLIGWSVAALYWTYTGFIGQRFDLSLAIIQFLTDVTLYVLLSHQYIKVAQRNGWQDLPLNKTVERLIPAILTMATAYMVVTVLKVYLLRRLAMPDYNQTLTDFFSINSFSIFIAGIRLMSIWLLAYHLYHYAQREIRIARENARLAVLTQQAQMQNLSSQLNPHFLFNSLNTIKSLVVENASSARRGIDLLSDLLRKSLNQEDQQLTTVNEEMELVNDYLELEKLRLEERLEQRISIPEDCLNLMIPRFSIQTLVENAVKHGIASQKSGGLIAIALTKTETSLLITVQNPGNLESSQSSTGIGLTNLKNRLQIHYQQSAAFEIVEKGNSILVTLKIPLT